MTHRIRFLELESSFLQIFQKSNLSRRSKAVYKNLQQAHSLSKVIFSLWIRVVDK